MPPNMIQMDQLKDVITSSITQAFAALLAANASDFQMAQAPQPEKSGGRSAKKLMDLAVAITCWSLPM
eukprot:UC4_evm9s426